MMGGGVFATLIFIFLFVLTILWFILPFAVFGIKDRMKNTHELIRDMSASVRALQVEIKKTNQLLAGVQTVKILSEYDGGLSVKKDPQNESTGRNQIEDVTEKEKAWLESIKKTPNELVSYDIENMCEKDVVEYLSYLASEASADANGKWKVITPIWGTNYFQNINEVKSFVRKLVQKFGAITRGHE